MMDKLIQEPQVVAHLLADDGTYPNNPTLPLLAYRQALRLPEQDPAAAFERLFQANGWGGSWRNGVYDVRPLVGAPLPQHGPRTFPNARCWASMAAMPACSSAARVGRCWRWRAAMPAAPAGVVVPAGVAHKNLGASDDFGVVGAYPRGQRPDMNYGEPGERPNAERNMARVPLPPADPVYAAGGLLGSHWG